MSGSNALAVSPKSVIAEIIEHLAAITPEQFVEPDMPPDADYRAVGEANDDIKRLFTLRTIAREQHNTLGKPLQEAIDKLTVEMKAAKTSLEKVGLLQKLVALDNDSETKRVVVEMARKHAFHEIIDKIFWLQLRYQYAELLDKPIISIRKNWTVGWNERGNEKNVIGSLDVLFGEEGGPQEMPDGFAEFLRSRFR